MQNRLNAMTAQMTNTALRASFSPVTSSSGKASSSTCTAKVKQKLYNDFISFSRVLELYVIFGTLIGGVCYNTNSTITELRYPSNVIDVNSNAENLTILLVVALWMTRVSIYWEATVGFGTMVVVFFCMFRFFKPRLFSCFDETRLNEIYLALKPLVLFDCIFIIIFGPIGNVYMFLLDCVETYLTIFLRIGF